VGQLEFNLYSPAPLGEEEVSVDHVVDRLGNAVLFERGEETQRAHGEGDHGGDRCVGGTSWNLKAAKA
jgi:hypothetical protein